MMRPMAGESGRHQNVELKARYPDSERAARISEGLGAEPGGTELQTDTYFSVGNYRMKLRESSIGNHWLIWYHRPDRPDSRISTYRLRAVPDPEAKRRILSQAMGVKAVVRKERTLYMLGPVRIHIDKVEGLGGFLEFEVVLGDGDDRSEGHRRVAELRREFEIEDGDLVSGSYSDLLETSEV
jgi:predicted adenylyl cyclase CyaB